MNSSDIAAALGIQNHLRYLKSVEDQMIDGLEPFDEMLSGPVIRLIQAGGKRLRPLLLFACANPKNSRFASKINFAGSAIELLHISSLIHDDIIDKSEFRHGIDSAFKEVGANKALLSGDLALALAFRFAGQSGQSVTGYMANAFELMCQGQSVELSSRFDTKRTIPSYLNSIKDKTAVLLASSCAIGGCFGRTASEQRILFSFGESFGMCFQLLDDLHDVVQKKADGGKPVQHDIDEGIYTYPTLLAIKDSKLIPKSAITIKSSISDIHIASTKEKILHYEKMAMKKTAELSDVVLGRRLASFVQWYNQTSLDSIFEP